VSFGTANVQVIADGIARSGWPRVARHCGDGWEPLVLLESKAPEGLEILLDTTLVLSS